MPSLPEHLQAVKAGQERLPREVMEAHQRDRVLDAAIDVFAGRGYLDSTVDHIVAAARIGVGTFYDLFENKADCFLQAYDRVVADARASLVAAVPAELPWPQRLRDGLAALLGLIAASPRQARIALVEVHTVVDGGPERFEATLAEAIPLLREGREQSELAAAAPATLELATAAGLAWALQRQLLAGGAEAIERTLPDMAAIALEPYLGEQAVADLLAAS